MSKSRSSSVVKPHPDNNKTAWKNPEPAALAKLRESVEVTPESVDTWERLGRALLDKTPQEAAETLHQALMLHSDHPTLLLLAGKAEYATGNRTKAQEHFERLVALRPDLFDAQFYLAKVLYDSAKYEQALQHIEKADNTKAGREDVLSDRKSTRLNSSH